MVLMDTRIKTTGYEMTPETSEYLASRLAHVEKLLGDDALTARCEVELGRDAGGQRHGEYVWFAEMQIIAPGSYRIRATNHSASINGAIDDVKEEVERQLKRERKLHIRIARTGGAFAKRLMRFGRAAEE